MPLVCDEAKLLACGAQLVTADFVDSQNVWQHNRQKLAEVLRRELRLREYAL